MSRDLLNQTCPARPSSIQKHRQKIECLSFKKGNCQFGSKCFFFHPPTPKPAATAPLNSQICRFFLKGTCFFGNRCRNLHQYSVSSYDYDKRQDLNNTVAYEKPDYMGFSKYVNYREKF
ncbi:unnamed protein product [Caenorhabditis angaria]|uniref:C3H1-type domain-containing protein n=1 Tax=Caenorhabditis angaria TaxID=860376 RepID=A0A9P1MZ75_9PELO|nr:unnamed protein product [Caenorhabditis angaria]